MLCCEKLSDIETAIRSYLNTKGESTTELYDKGLMTDFNFEKMKLEYEN